MTKPLPIGERLRRAIVRAEARGVTKYRIAQLAEIDQTNLRRIIKGEVVPKVDTAERLAHAIGYKLRLDRDP